MYHSLQHRCQGRSIPLGSYGSSPSTSTKAGGHVTGQAAPSTRCHNRLPRFCVDDVIITSYGAPASPEEAGTLAVYPAEVAQDFDKNTFSVWLFQRFAVMLARAAAQA